MNTIQNFRLDDFTKRALDKAGEEYGFKRGSLSVYLRECCVALSGIQRGETNTHYVWIEGKQSKSFKVTITVEG